MVRAETDRTAEGMTAAIDAVLAMPDDALAPAAPVVAGRLLALGETVLEAWLIAQGKAPTTACSEGFRLLALHRQAAQGDPSFNACRETCRELVYQHNLVHLAPDHAGVVHRIRLGAMVARHLALFVVGKLEVAGLGEFCCSSRPLRERDAVSPGAETGR